MTGPSVSVIVPARNAASYLSEALESIRAQTRAPDQVIVVDDGSTDETAEIAEAQAEPVTLIKRSHGGVGAAVNSGLAAADGELISFLDADDLWTANKLEVQCAALAAEPKIDMVFGHVEQFLSPELSDEQRVLLRAPGRVSPAKLKGTMLIRRVSLERVGLLSTSLQVADFVEWYSRAREHGLRDQVVGDVVLKRRIHLANNGRLQRAARVEYAQVLARARLRRRR
jgi:glycosyltransferase involved in cell wall biosynthesis